MNSAENTAWEILQFVIGIVKDKALQDCLIRVGDAQRHYLIAKANEKRKQEQALIRARAKLEISLQKMQLTYDKVKPSLSSEAQAAMQKLLDDIRWEIQDTIQEKNKISGQTSHLALPSRSEEVNGVKLLPGDVLAVTRRGGLYQHFAVYIGNQKVIHYAAESGDFSGRISIHEAPFQEFKMDSTFVYVLDFPPESGKPYHRGIPSFGEKEEEADLFGAVRAQGYHLYTPEETVDRAKSRLGESNYSLPVNNCEHFAIWCKTGVEESHQVNAWVTRLINFAGKYTG